MDFAEIFDKETMDALLAEAKAAGVSAKDVKAVLGQLDGDAVMRGGIDTDGDGIVDAFADASGVERGKTGTVLMLAAPLILKYLLGNGSNANANGSQTGGMNPMVIAALLSMFLGNQQSSGSGTGSLLGSLLGGQTQQPAQNSTASLLGSLLGGQTQQTQPAQNSTASLLGALLGGQTQQTQPAQNSTASLLGALLGSQTQPSQTQQSAGNLLDLMGNQVQPQQSQQSQQGGTGSILNALLGLLGDN